MLEGYQYIFFLWKVGMVNRYEGGFEFQCCQYFLKVRENVI